MRKFAVAALAACLVLPAAATAGDFSGGVSLFDFDDVGFQGRLTNDFVLEGSRIAAGATYFVDGSYLAVDGDLHFSLSHEDLKNVYPLIGLQVATDFDFTELGLNAGAGYGFGLTRPMSAFVEAKYTFGDVDGFTATFGVYF
ncbi:MAG TPA: hypothetical protein PLL30_16505 [Candidatus Krumholzibacteria bacterium]|nr:hypothetical protein [Candidatus Krumholzibacteria bacterium]HPD73374.1 hypothetical protein [Candidatus Krumholzibacteria bacterium]HRY42105.1 hypothetical protein [Candidatus Krumholzibacteria bacterium]